MLSIQFWIIKQFDIQKGKWRYKTLYFKLNFTNQRKYFKERTKTKVITTNHPWLLYQHQVKKETKVAIKQEDASENNGKRILLRIINNVDVSISWWEECHFRIGDLIFKIFIYGVNRNSKFIIESYTNH